MARRGRTPVLSRLSKDGEQRIARPYDNVAHCSAVTLAQASRAHHGQEVLLGWAVVYPTPIASVAFRHDNLTESSGSTVVHLLPDFPFRSGIHHQQLLSTQRTSLRDTAHGGVGVRLRPLSAAPHPSAGQAASEGSATLLSRYPASTSSPGTRPPRRSPYPSFPSAPYFPPCRSSP